MRNVTLQKNHYEHAVTTFGKNDVTYGRKIVEIVLFLPHIFVTPERKWTYYISKC